MSNVRQIVIGPSPERPAVVLRRGVDLARFKAVGEERSLDGALGRALAALQGLPDLLLAGSVATSRLMEVQIHGNLVHAADGVGYRAFAVGNGGIVEQARLLDPSSLTALIDVALVWRLASVVVGQKHLADIGATLKTLEKGVSHIARFQRDEQASKIESAYEYLRQVERALTHGEREPAVRYRLEAIEAEMDAIQRHLTKLFESRLDTRILHENLLGYSELEAGLPAKLEELQKILQEHRLAGWTRKIALQMLAIFPGEAGLKAARSTAISESAAKNDAMCKQLEQCMALEVSLWRGNAEAVATAGGKIVDAIFQLGKGMSSKGMSSIAKREQTSAETALASGSATPKLDALKLASLSMIHQAANAEARSARRLADATHSVTTLLKEVEETTHYLVEWGEKEPTRIRQIPVRPVGA